MRAGRVLIVGVVVGLATPAFAQTLPSLADLARQAEAARGAVKKAARTYTNVDLTPEQQRTEPPPAPKAPEAAFVSKTTGEAVTAEEMVSKSQAIIAQNTQNMGEDHWRNRAASLRAELERARKNFELLSTAPPPRTEGLRQVAAKELERARRTLASVEKRWQDLEASAGFARVPSAWLQP